MIIYTAGFLFDSTYEHLALIKKTKPAWQKGMWNAIGGKYEPNDISVLHTQIREFREETDVEFTEWKELARIIHTQNDYVLHFFYGNSDKVFDVKQTTEEQPLVFPVKNITWNLAPNLTWLIPLALSNTTLELPFILRDGGGN